MCWVGMCLYLVLCLGIFWTSVRDVGRAAWVELKWVWGRDNFLPRCGGAGGYAWIY